MDLHYVAAITFAAIGLILTLAGIFYGKSLTPLVGAFACYAASMAAILIKAARRP